MGRVKTTLIKRTASRLLRDNPGKFSEEFDKNKKIVCEFAEIPSKKLRNVLAGLLAREVRKEKT